MKPNRNPTTLSRNGLRLTIPSHATLEERDTITHAFMVYAFVIPFPDSIAGQHVTLEVFADALEANCGAHSPRLRHILGTLRGASAYANAPAATHRVAGSPVFFAN